MRIEETTVIYQLFGGSLQSQVKCEKCGNVNGSLESFLDLNLDLSQNALSVEEALMNFVRIEKLDESTGYKCEKYVLMISTGVTSTKRECTDAIKQCQHKNN